MLETIEGTCATCTGWQPASSGATEAPCTRINDRGASPGEPMLHVVPGPGAQTGRAWLTTPRTFTCRLHNGAAGQAAAGPAAAQEAAGAANAPGRTPDETLTLEKVLALYHGGPQDGVFTDGSASPNPGPGGWGFVWVEDGRIVRQKCGHAEETTNNRMELTALIEAYKALPEDAQGIVIRSDSQLAVRTITEWAAGWERRGWRRKGGAISNLDLVKELLALDRAHPGCRLEWTRGHAGNRWNEYADALASAWMRKEA